MNDRERTPHHPLPEDERSRHDLLPESIGTARDGDRDDGLEPDRGAPVLDVLDAADASEPPHDRYRNPDGSPYES